MIKRQLHRQIHKVCTSFKYLTGEKEFVPKTKLALIKKEHKKLC